MKYRPLPALEYIQSLVAENRTADAQACTTSAILDLIKHPGFQLVLAAIQTVEGGALEDIRTGTAKNVDHSAGQIYAADRIRKQILALIPDEVTLADAEPQEEFEANEAYSSGFDIFPPSGA